MILSFKLLKFKYCILNLDSLIKTYNESCITGLSHMKNQLPFPNFPCESLNDSKKRLRQNDTYLKIEVCVEHSITQ